RDPRGRRLPAARLPHDRERLTELDLEAHVVDRGERGPLRHRAFAPGDELLRHAANLQQRHADTSSSILGTASSSIRVYSWRGSENTCSADPYSTGSPSRITSTRCAIELITARSW